MVGGFLVQMWEIFIQFHNELKTIAVSFEEKAALEFPSIAICDSRAFTELSTMTANAMRYNSTTFSVLGCSKEFGQRLPSNIGLLLRKL